MRNETTKKKEKRLLKKITAEVKRWEKILYLSEWRLEIKLDDLSNIDNDDGKKYLAITEMIVPYREAVIVFDVNIPPDDIEVTVIHELVHLIIHPIVAQIDNLLPKRITEEEKNIIHNSEERAVSDITHITKSRIQYYIKRRKRKTQQLERR